MLKVYESIVKDKIMKLTIFSQMHSMASYHACVF